MFDLFRPRRSVCTALVAASTLLLLSGAWSGANAQAVKGALLGNITDDEGLALPGVTVTITEQNTNITYSTVANESGYYVFSNLKDGTYRVESDSRDSRRRSARTFASMSTRRSAST
jgi:hypothetical protein